MANRLLKLINKQTKGFNNKYTYNFTSVFNNNNIVVICSKSILILYKDLVIL